MLNDLHPAPADRYATDHRSSPNREQLKLPSELSSIWIRAVESMAEELQIPPIEAHFLLQDASWEITKGIAWELWLT